jgi:hypothetical protein
MTRWESFHSANRGNGRVETWRGRANELCMLAVASVLVLVLCNVPASDSKQIFKTASILSSPIRMVSSQPIWFPFQHRLPQAINGKSYRATARMVYTDASRHVIDNPAGLESLELTEAQRLHRTSTVSIPTQSAS